MVVYDIVCLLVAGCPQNALDLVFVLDSSGSIRDSNPTDGSFDNWALLLQFVINIIQQLPIGEDFFRVGVVRFSNSGDSIFYLSSYLDDKPSMIEAVSNMRYIGSDTNTASGLREMIMGQFLESRGDRRFVNNLAIVITDGVSTVDKALTIPTAIDAQERGINMFTVGITSAIDEEEIRLMSSQPQIEGETFWRITDFTQLDNIVDSVVNQACQVPSGKFSCFH